MNLISFDAERRRELLRRLDGDARFTVAMLAERADAECGVVVFDSAGLESYAAELAGHLSRDGAGPKLLVVVRDEDDLELACSLVLAGASGIASLRQPAECLCEAVVDVADGLASVSSAIETELVRHLQSLTD